MAKILQIGSWNENGMPIGWHLHCDEIPSCGWIMNIEKDGMVLVGEVEIVEWTEARRRAIKPYIL